MNAPIRMPGQPAAIGDNNPPPEPTPFDLSRDEIEGLCAEARNWADGTLVETEEQEAEVARLIGLLGDAITVAEGRRKAEVKPFDDGKAEVQGRYNPLIADTKTAQGSAILARKALQQSVQAFRVKRQEERDRAAVEARAEAERQRQAAAAALQAAPVTDLAAREAAEAQAREAKAAEAAARKASKPTATGLRTRYVATIDDPRAFARWAWEHHRAAVDEMFAGLAQRLCDARIREMPGVTIEPVRSAT